MALRTLASHVSLNAVQMIALVVVSVTIKMVLVRATMMKQANLTLGLHVNSRAAQQTALVAESAIGQMASACARMVTQESNVRRLCNVQQRTS